MSVEKMGRERGVAAKRPRCARRRLGFGRRVLFFCVRSEGGVRSSGRAGKRRLSTTATKAERPMPANENLPKLKTAPPMPVVSVTEMMTTLREEERLMRLWSRL